MPLAFRPGTGGEDGTRAFDPIDLSSRAAKRACPAFSAHHPGPHARSVCRSAREYIATLRQKAGLRLVTRPLVDGAVLDLDTFNDRATAFAVTKLGCRWTDMPPVPLAEAAPAKRWRFVGQTSKWLHRRRERRHHGDPEEEEHDRELTLDILWPEDGKRLIIEVVGPDATGLEAWVALFVRDVISGQETSSDANAADDEPDDAGHQAMDTD